MLPPQKRSNRSRAFSNTSKAVRLPDGELIAGSNVGSSMQRRVEPGTGLSNRSDLFTAAKVDPLSFHAVNHLAIFKFIDTF